MTDGTTASIAERERELARHLPFDRFGAIRAVTPIHVGLSGAAVYSVTTDTGAFVLRHTPAIDAAKWTQELAIMRLASDHGIAPRLEHVDDAGRATVSARIAALPPSAAFGDPAARPRVLASLVEMLTRLHALPVHGIPPADPLHAARERWNVQVGRAGFPNWALPLADHFERCERVLASDERRVLSHNDANPGNILWDGERVWLIDWTASGATHPYYDLAAVAMFTMLPDDVALGLLARQEGAAIMPEQAETFRALRKIATILCGMLFLGLVPELASLVPERAEEAPTLPEYYRMLMTGALSMQTAAGQAMFGIALLRDALER